MICVGDIVPSFQLPDQDAALVEVNARQGFFVIYFYPRDNTPGCTTEAGDFSAFLPEFHALGLEVYGISPDSVASHKKFIQNRQILVKLLSDQDLEVAKIFGVWQLKKNYGKEYMGIVRTTFLVAPDGRLVERWDKVRVKGHAAAVLAAARVHVAKSK